MIPELEELARQHAEGLLTYDEFRAARRRVLGFDQDPGPPVLELEPEPLAPVEVPAPIAEATLPPRSPAKRKRRQRPWQHLVLMAVAFAVVVDGVAILAAHSRSSETPSAGEEQDPGPILGPAVTSSPAGGTDKTSLIGVWETGPQWTSAKPPPDDSQSSFLMFKEDGSWAYPYLGGEDRALCLGGFWRRTGPHSYSMANSRGGSDVAHLDGTNLVLTPGEGPEVTYIRSSQSAPAKWC